MHTALYKFEVKQSQAEQFIAVWEELTHLFMKHAGALGSRLHQVEQNIYIAYAQWPDEATYAKASSKMPERAEELRATMRATCESVETLYQMNVVNDLLIKEEHE